MATPSEDIPDGKPIPYYITIAELLEIAKDELIESCMLLSEFLYPRGD